MSFSEIIEVLMRFVSDYGDVINSLGVSAVIAYLFFEINEEFFLSILRLLGRALRWVHQHLFLIYAWVSVLSAILCASFSIYLSLNYPTVTQSLLDDLFLLLPVVWSFLLVKCHKWFSL